MKKNPLLAQIEKQIRARYKESAKLDAQRAIETARQAEKVAGLLARAGIVTAFDAEKASYPVFDLEVGQLVAARHALGRFEHYSTGVAGDNKVEVRLRCVEFSRVKVRYVRELPEISKCKIVTTMNTYTTTNLVCQRAG
jgi:hypothetical protein